MSKPDFFNLIFGWKNKMFFICGLFKSKKLPSTTEWQDGNKILKQGFKLKLLWNHSQTETHRLSQIESGPRSLSKPNA